MKTKQVSQIRPEVNHPSFTAIRGRPRQIDFVGYDKTGNWKFVIESKFLPGTLQSIANDVSRLLLVDKPRCEKFFVLAVEKKDKSISEAFKINMNVGKRRVNVLGQLFSRTKDKVRITNIKRAPTEIAGLFRNFMQDYDLEEMPNAFQTKCVNFTTTKFFAGGIWRVSARQGTRQVSIEDLNVSP